MKYHAGDLSRIWVLDTKEERYIEVEAVNRTYTDGLSLWKHRVIRAYVREEMKKEVNQEALGEARVQLHREMREAVGSLKSLQSRAWGSAVDESACVSVAWRRDYGRNDAREGREV